MFAIERFIASAIRFVRIEPEAPTSMPPTISATLSSAIPAAAADRPVKAFSSEITTGMSAPPIGSTNMLPSSAAATRITTNSPCDSVPAAIAIAQPTATASSPTLMNCWPGSWIGRPGRISWSFPNAMFEPQNETEPMIAANRIGISCVERDAVAARAVAELDQRDQRHRAAADAVEQRHHLRHRGHLHAARRGHADGRADRDAEHDQPVVADRRDQQRRRPRRSPCRPRRSRLPRRAVRGWFSSCSP